MTSNPFAALLRDVPRYDGYWTFDPDGDVVRLSDVLAALAAAVPADLAEAGKVADAADIYQFWVGDNLVNLGQTIRSLLARIAAQEAQINGLMNGTGAASQMALDYMARAEAAETTLAAERAKTAKLVEMLVGEREENLWNCYNVGRERDGRWSDCCMSDAEWLVLQCGLDPDQPDYDAAEVKAAIPVAARAAITEAGQ